MKSRPSLLLAWFFAATCTLGFFMPWARFAPESTAHNTLAIANTLLQGEDDLLSSYLWMRKSEAKALFNHPGEGLSAYQIILLSEEDTLSSKVARAWLSMLWGGEDAALRVKVIVLVPLLALLGAFFLTFSKPSQRWLLALALAQFAAYFFLRWKLNLSYTDRLLWQIELSWGLWLGLFALLGEAIITLIRALLPPKSRF
jgi:hypothetical protein